MTCVAQQKVLRSKLDTEAIRVEYIKAPDGGYGDAVGRGKMSLYPLCAISVDGKGKGLRN